MKNLFFLITLLLSASCMITKYEANSSFSVKPEELKTLQAQCHEIAAEGDIFTLMSQIKEQTAWSLKMLNSAHPDYYQDDVTRVAASIHEKAERVKSLSRKEWTTDNWQQKVAWLINQDDFADLLGVQFRNGFEIASYHIESVSLNGERRDDLIKNLTVKKTQSRVAVEYNKKSSSLDICQLQKTLVVTIRIEYRNISNYDLRYFNLSVK